MSHWVQLLGGGVMLYIGAEWLVGGASALALALRIPQILVGLTVVAYGTSTPEVIVGVQAAGAGHADVALGNVIGSNIANIGLILGCAAVIRPARVDGTLKRRELPVLLFSTALLPVLLFDGVVTHVESALLVFVALLYTGLMIRSARQASAVASASREAKATFEAADVAGAPRPIGTGRAALTALAGLGILLLGGNLFVEGAVTLAQTFGMSERLVGLTIVAVGTSLPELVTSIVAARRGDSDIAVGNVVGSNIFNVFLCLGAAGLAGKMEIPLHTVAIDLIALVVMTVLAAIFIRTERTITRAEGMIALALYVCFVGITVATA